MCSCSGSRYCISTCTPASSFAFAFPTTNTNQSRNAISLPSLSHDLDKDTRTYTQPRRYLPKPQNPSHRPSSASSRPHLTHLHPSIPHSPIGPFPSHTLAHPHAPISASTCTPINFPVLDAWVMRLVGVAYCMHANGPVMSRVLTVYHGFERGRMERGWNRKVWC